MRTRWSLLLSCAALLTGLFVLGPEAGAQGPIKIGFVQGLTGPFEVYAKQEVNGFKLGLEYATGGKMEVLGRKIEVIVEDDQLKPDVSKQKVTKLYADDKVDLVVGTTSIAAALAIAKPGVSIATIAQDYAFGKDGVAAYKAAVEKLGGKVVHEEYAPV